MAIPAKRASSAESLATISNVVLSAAIVLALYFGRDLLVPLALSVLLTFMLAPLVTRLQRWIGRICAVLVVVVVVMMFGATGAVGWMLTGQAIDLANKLPSYKQNIQDTLRSIHVPGQAAISKITQTIDELKEDLPGGSADGPDAKPRAKIKVTSVEIVSGKNERLAFMKGIHRKQNDYKNHVFSFSKTLYEKSFLTELLVCLPCTPFPKTTTAASQGRRLRVRVSRRRSDLPSIATDE